jgi:hypothetical protein
VAKETVTASWSQAHLNFAPKQRKNSNQPLEIGLCHVTSSSLALLQLY